MLTQLAAIANSDTAHLFVALGDFRMLETFAQSPYGGIYGVSGSVGPYYQIEFRMQIVFGRGGRSRKLSSFTTRKLAYCKLCLASRVQVPVSQYPAEAKVECKRICYNFQKFL